ncbi:MAG: hypothetical protein KJ905_01265 [Nanoarchaeota archaeon]|nr:hypothetical protein [Nanoarchaeota archaeon]MBU1501389.1 hypothetical protein [Nanoarchaeota archaeon]
MRFEIDISGSDIFDPDYVICISSKELFNGRRIIKGFKIDEELIKTLIKKWKGNKYRYYYDQYEQTRGTFKVRIYCIIIYYLFKSLGIREKISLTICRDFSGRENTVNQNLKFLFENEGGMTMGIPLYQKLPSSSLSHWYARNMANDSENRLDTYVNISLEDIEKFLRKRK